jgi:hypothetical protein
MSQSSIALLPIGVFRKDQLPIQKREGHYIINLESSTDEDEGSHWVAFYISHKKNRSFYWDSFGVPFAPTLVKNIYSAIQTISFKTTPASIEWHILRMVCYCCLLLASC